MPKEFWSGDDGQSAEDIMGQRSATENEQSARAKMSGKSGVADALRKLGAGDMDLEQLMRMGGSGIEKDELRQKALTDAISGRRLAGEAVRGDDVSGLLYGQEGLAQQLAGEGRRLAGEGGQFQPEDNEAFGQASDSIARMAAQRESDLANSMAGRGFGQAGSGAAGAAFSGLAGNKFEQLARAQTSIADQRKQRQLQQLQENRRMQAQLGQQYGQELGSQFQRGQQNRGMEMSQREAQREADMRNRIAQQSQLNEAFSQKAQTKRKGFFQNLGDAFTSGFSKGVARLGQDSTPGGAVEGVSSIFGGGSGGGGGEEGGGGGGGGAGAGLMAMFSDENAKEDIRYSSDEVADLFRALNPATFEYKDPEAMGAGEGPRAGIMAQDMEAAGPLGEGMVHDTEQGKMLDSNALLSALMAQASGLQQEVDSLKKKKGKA